MQLVIGTKTWSSWSMRPWLVLKRAGLPFEEQVIRLRRADTSEAEIRAAGSPNGKVPVLRDGDLTVWDSLAIAEYLADRCPEASLWPADRHTRALARSAAAEMHAGFASLRGECPMDLRLQKTAELSELTHQDIRRIVQLWSGLRERHQANGDFLCGLWSIADAFYTPVATRFRSYGVQLSDYGDHGAAADYCTRLLETPEFKQWEAEAAEEELG